MALYLISYDIAEKEAFEYQPLWDRLKQLGATRLLYSEWAIVDDVGPATSIYAKLAPLTQEKDRLLVQELTKDAQWDKLLISNESYHRLLAHARR